MTFEFTLLNDFKVNMYYVYVLQSFKDDKMYTGYTNNLKSRFELHKKGKVESTKD